MKKVTVTFVTCANRKQAERIAGKLVEERLAACVNIVPGVTSIYRWEGKIQKGKEVLLIIKSIRACAVKLAKRVKDLHSYSVPEVVTFSVDSGLLPYLAWVKKEVKG